MQVVGKSGAYVECPREQDLGRKPTTAIRLDKVRKDKESRLMNLNSSQCDSSK